MSKLIFKTLAGSRLYGVATKDSDYDYKGVFLETLPQLLNKSDNVTRSVESETSSEYEAFSLNYYMKLLGQGQVIPLDMLFAPKEFWTVTSLEWEKLQEHKSSMISSNITPFVVYAKGQAMKYGLKGNKILTIDKAIKIVNLGFTFDSICSELADMEGVSFEVEKTANKSIRHIVICGKSFSETTKLDLWIGPLNKLRKSFGKRAEDASDGVDLKAQYHTVRICHEAIELLETGKLTFPRPEAELLIRIRNNELSLTQLEALVEDCFEKVKEAEKTTNLPAAPDYELMNSLVYAAQFDYITKSHA